MTRKAARSLIGLGILGLVLVAFGTWRAWQPGADGTSRETQAQRPALDVDPDSIHEKTSEDDSARGDQKGQLAFLEHQAGSVGWATTEENPTLARR